jgi:hypothetical protein
MNVSQFGFGYQWKKTLRNLFKLDPVAIDYLRVVESSSEFKEYLETYPEVARSFERQLIVGSKFSYTWSVNPKKKQFNQFYYNGLLDVSGNLIDAVYTISGSKEPGKPGELFGVPYSQYVKVTNDFRYYIYFSEKRQLATRVLAGVGVPVGNSKVLPYIKQYFAGGSQDIRAFYARSLGPGSYTPPDSLQSSLLLDQSGEVKLLGSIEYRFPIIYKVYGALFVDAGNVWLLNEDETRPGGKLEFNRLLDDKLDELARLVAGFDKIQHRHHGYFFRRQLWDFIIASDLIARGNIKPRGYSGDSKMMNLIYS